MAKLNQNDKPTKGINKSLEAGIAGAGGGTLFVLIAETVPENWGIKPILKYLAPAVSIMLSGFWLLVKKEYSSYNSNRKLNLVLKQLDEFMNDPSTSQNHKDLLRQKREEIQIAIVSKRMVEVQKLHEELLA